jgi:hypothetical protein
MSALLLQLRPRLERAESLIKRAIATANAALTAATSSSPGYDVIVDSTLNNIPADGVLYTVAQYDLTAVQRAAYIEFQWVVHEPVALTMAARRQGSAFDANAPVGVADNPVGLKNNMFIAPGFLFTTVGTILVAQVSNTIGNSGPVNARAVIKIQFNPKP